MLSTRCQILGIIVALIGFVGTILICGLPAWKVSAFIGSNIVTSQIFWEGLWMNCVVESTGQMQCKVYDSLLALPQDLQAARALVVVALAVGIFGIILTIIGGKCTNFIADEDSKAKVVIAGGIVFIISGLLVMIPVCWTTNVIVRDFYNPILLDAQKRELGASIYGEMASLRLQMLGSALALLGWAGVLLTCIMPMWRVTAFVGMTIVTSEIMWEGIWMTCVLQSTGYIQCKPYESMLALGTDLKAAQVLTVGSILTGALGLTLAFIGGKCTRFLDHSGEARKARVATAAGVVLIITGLLCLIPVTWSAIAVVQAFYNPLMTDSQRREIGAAIYIGCGASILLFLGGGMLCSTSCDQKGEHESPSVKYMIVQSSRAGSSNRSSQRVWITKPAQNGAPLMMPQWSNGESANQQQDRPASAGSKPSKPSTIKSQLALLNSTVESKQSERQSPTTQSQIHIDSDQSLETSEANESTSANPEKTYI
ncbi:uncharacterized protein [Salminus brasiliensis]|uniref:uncharacterized protein n=1 Tax=Salminus brasiliensis TaxID=930266 RepID=UPI003B835B87